VVLLLLFGDFVFCGGLYGVGWCYWLFGCVVWTLVVGCMCFSCCSWCMVVVISHTLLTLTFGGLFVVFRLVHSV